MLDKIKTYFLETLWNFSLSEKKGKGRFFLKSLRIDFLSVRGFIEDQCSLRASSLTYYTVMSVVPVLALAFAVARGFGIYQNFRAQILIQFSEHMAVLQELFGYAETLLERTRGGVVASFGLVVLGFTVILLLSNVEGILNHIWGVKSLRNWWRIFTDYLAIMILSPVFFIAATTVTVFAEEKMTLFVRALPLMEGVIDAIVFCIHLIAFTLLWILFALIYFIMPNVKVRLSSAFLAGVFTGTAYLILQWIYIKFQVGVSRYGAIYGSMAAVPLFLVWLQLSWSLFLFGAEISYAHQNLEEYEYEGLIGKASLRLKRLASLWTLALAVQNDFLTPEFLTTEHHIPKKFAKALLEELVEANLLMKGKNGFFPAENMAQMSLFEALEKLEMRGINRFPFMDLKAFAIFEKAFEGFKSALDSHPQNIRIQDVSHSL
jgi:membrane protein